MSEKKTVKVTLVKSPIGTKADHRATLAGLGLKKIRQSRVLEDTPAACGDQQGCVPRARRMIERITKCV